MTSAPGFYGKVPALGDFVSRRLPPGFLAQWDRFLADIVQSSRLVLGAAWLDAWNEAPVWHFGLGAGIAGPERWFGVLIPSVDRVGRQFPFTILGPEAQSGFGYADWSLRIEALAIDVLEDSFDTARLDAALAELGGPEPPRAAPLSDLPDGATRWTCRDAPRHPAGVIGFDGLPPAHAAAELVGGAAPAGSPDLASG